MENPATPVDAASPVNRWLAWPRVLWLALGAAALVSLTVFRMGLFGDDFIYLGILSGQTPPAPLANGPFDLYRFIAGDPAISVPLTQKGIFPWWTLPELKLAFWRPLSSVTMMVDHALFGENPAAFHVHSVLWYLGVVAVFGLLMRRTLAGAVGAVALLLFAIDDCHAVPVGWWCNRNAIVATLPALAGLWLHMEWREHGRKWAAPLSLVALALGLTGGETALGVLAYVLAYELLGARGPWRQRLLSVAPAAVLALGYLAFYKHEGYGSFGSDLYVDPLSQPGAWLAVAAVRIPAMLWGLLLSIPTELSMMVGDGLTIGVGLFALALVAGLLRAVWPFLSEDERRHSRWLLAGAFLALLPVSSTIQGDRLLLVPSIGGVAVIAMVLTHVWRNRARSGGWRALTGVAGVLAVTHVLLAPVGWYLATSYMVRMTGSADRVYAQLKKDLDPAALPNQRLAVLTLPNPNLNIYTSVAWWARGNPLPRAWWTLSYASDIHKLTRTGPNSLEMELTQERFFDTIFERVHRAGRFMLKQGDEVKLDGMTAKVVEADARGIKRLSFTFDVPLEDPSLVLLHWKDRGLRRVVLPPMGTTVALDYGGLQPPPQATSNAP
ncbi:hypothetical protein JY651_26155 [Pyxidicoccus parkwayensis]|uniref:Glycosyltransferase RgtA/B/C/D-like domain-containing protein n=1 Tax=Pyxidicoccus parkwayensis TaxID=2813578 RepID=A0ABX7NMZ4_9BACT|nr:hypothetical protein [Pyxidicoccus parkwaysis]QSQ18844.1 hypothetical protein JY651_26155 [Pyxidicoccus parkwaysis]